MLGGNHGIRVQNKDGETSISSPIVNSSVEKTDHGGRLVGTIEIHQQLPKILTINGLQLDLTVTENTVISLIQKHHQISYTLEGNKIGLNKSFDTALFKTVLAKNTRTQIPFSVDLSKEEVDKLGSIKLYDQDNTLCHEEDSTNIGYCAASKRNPGAHSFTSGTCEIRTILQATLTLCNKNTGRQEKVRGYGVPLNNDSDIGSTDLLALSVIASESAPTVAFCGLFEIPRRQTFLFERNDQKRVYWSKGDLEVIIDETLQSEYAHLAIKTIVKLTQRISWSAESKELLQYVEFRNRHSPSIVKPVVHCSQPRTLVMEDQCIYWQYPLCSVNRGTVPFPKSPRMRSTYQGQSIEVYHEIWVCTFGENNHVVATSQPLPVVIHVE
mmetsp:Transcript_46939/g.142164  ORF Transcript_46939/g.142164 Transcript_46939/m.142164 type:complete len:383 (-) Transcript_46939:384-1532(-)